LLSSGCSSWREVLPVEVKTVEVERKIPTQNRPRPVKLNDVYFYVVTEDTLDEFKKRFAKDNGDLLFYALSVRDYETIAFNMAELKRYIDQQKQVIVYYEKAVAPKEKKEDKDGKIQR
jgi:hypothetical protein